MGPTGSQGDDLVFEPALGDGPGGPIVGLEGEPVHRLAADVPALGDGLGRQALVDEVEALVGTAGP